MMQMDWFGLKVKSSETLKTENEGQLQYIELDNVDEEGLLVCRDAFVLSPSDTLNSDELLGFDGDLLIATGLSDEENDQMMSKHSSKGSDGTYPCSTSSNSSPEKPDNYTELNNSVADWLLSKTGKLKEECQKIDSDAYANSPKTNNFALHTGRRSYSLGDSNSKNAIAARDNRLKKKKYIADLEESQRHLLAENELLKLQVQKNSDVINSLQNEVSYLKRVIANQTTLSAVLKNVMKTPGIHVSTLFSPHINHKPSKPECVNLSYTTAGSEKDMGEISVVKTQNSNGPYCSTSSSKQTAYLSVSRKGSRQKIGRKKLNLRQKKKITNEDEFNELVDVESTGDLDVPYASFSKPSGTDNGGGICLHVSGQNVSLEFCSHCNESAHLGLMLDHSYVNS